MEFKEKVYLKDGRALDRVIGFTGQHEGYIKEGEVITGVFCFETFSNIRFKSLKNNKVYYSKDVGVTSPIMALVSAIHGAYTQRQMLDMKAC